MVDEVTTSHASKAGTLDFILVCLQNSSYVKCRNYCVQHDTKALRRSRVEDKLEANRKKISVHPYPPQRDYKQYVKSSGQRKTC